MSVLTGSLPGIAAAAHDAGERIAISETVADDGPFHFRIGCVSVSVRCVHVPSMRAFRRLYSACTLATAARDAISVEILRTRDGKSLRRRYEVWADGVKRFTVWNVDEIVPHIEWAINWQIMLFHPRFYLVHAGVVEIDGAGVILPAAPGSGKTTLTAGLIARGARYLSDEFAMIDPETLRLQPYPKALCVKEGSFEVLDRLGAGMSGRPVFCKGKKGRVVLIRPDEVGGEVSEGCPVRHIMFCQYAADRKPSITPISRADGVLRLVRESFTFLKFRASGIDLLTDIVRGAQCYELASGPLEETRDLVLHTVRGG